MVMTMDEIRERVVPVAEKYELKAVYIFGSYARGEATDDSDVDILVDRDGSKIKSMFDMGGLYNDFCDCVGKEIDLVTTQTLEQSITKERSALFIESLMAERIKIYPER